MWTDSVECITLLFLLSVRSVANSLILNIEIELIGLPILFCIPVQKVELLGYMNNTELKSS